MPKAVSPAAARTSQRVIVSSSQLVSPRSQEVSELEFGLTVAWNAFSRCAVFCMVAADFARTMRTMSGLYDQAARAASSL